MAQQNDLTNLPAVKDWLNTSGQAYPPGSDQKLGDLITRASRFVQSYCRRFIVPQTYTEVKDGTGTSTLFMRHFPIIAVQAVTIGTTVIPASPQGSYSWGYITDGDRQLFLVNGIFTPARQNVKIVYTAGYQATGTITVPQNEPFPVANLFGTAQFVEIVAGSWSCDRGVAYVSGAALTLVPSNPAQGQYSVFAQADGSWAYQFSQADAGAQVVITYGYVPEDLEQAVIELVGERFKARNRIGEVSQHVGQSQTVSFSQKDMNDFIKSILDYYADVVPGLD